LMMQRYQYFLTTANFHTLFLKNKKEIHFVLLVICIIFTFGS